VTIDWQAMLQQIETQYGFTLPRAYRAFAERGYLSLGPSYLWVPEAEWLAPSEMLDTGGFWGVPKTGLVAFAKSGGRDLWGWQTQRISEAGEPAIVYCPRDSYVGSWHAPSLLGWLYRLSLEYVTPMWDDELDHRKKLRTFARVLREFDEPQWSADLEGVAARPVRTITLGGRLNERRMDALMDQHEVEDRVRRSFGRDYVEAPYVWDVAGDTEAG
jgi:hypothetical protein